MRSKQRGFTLTEIFVVVSFLAVIAVIVGTIFVGWHFIAKFW